MNIDSSEYDYEEIKSKKDAFEKRIEESLNQSDTKNAKIQNTYPEIATELQNIDKEKPIAPKVTRKDIESARQKLKYNRQFKEWIHNKELVVKQFYEKQLRDFERSADEYKEWLENKPTPITRVLDSYIQNRESENIQEKKQGGQEQSEENQKSPPGGDKYIEPEPEPEFASDPEPESASDPEPESASEPEPEFASNPEPESEPEFASIPEPESASEPEPEFASDPEPEFASDPEPESASIPEPESASIPEPESASEPTTEPESSPNFNLNSDESDYKQKENTWLTKKPEIKKRPRKWSIFYKSYMNLDIQEYDKNKIESQENDYEKRIKTALHSFGNKVDFVKHYSKIYWPEAENAELYNPMSVWEEAPLIKLLQDYDAKKPTLEEINIDELFVGNVHTTNSVTKAYTTKCGTQIFQLCDNLNYIDYVNKLPSGMNPDTIHKCINIREIYDNFDEYKSGQSNELYYKDTKKRVPSFEKNYIESQVVSNVEKNKQYVIPIELNLLKDDVSQFDACQHKVVPILTIVFEFQIEIKEETLESKADPSIFNKGDENVQYNGIIEYNGYAEIINDSVLIDNASLNNFKMKELKGKKWCDYR